MTNVCGSNVTRLGEPAFGNDGPSTVPSFAVASTLTNRTRSSPSVPWLLIGSLSRTRNVAEIRPSGSVEDPPRRPAPPRPPDDYPADAIVIDSRRFRAVRDDLRAARRAMDNAERDLKAAREAFANALAPPRRLDVHAPDGVGCALQRHVVELATKAARVAACLAEIVIPKWFVLADDDLALEEPDLPLVEGACG